MNANPTIAAYTDSQLLSVIDRAEGIDTDLALALVECGRGDESPTVTARQTDDLSMRANNVRYTLGELYAEAESRGLVRVL